MSDELSRRNLLRAGAAATAGLGVVGPASADTTAVEGQIPCVDLTDAEDRTTTVSASEPLPEPATGIRPGSQMIITIEDDGTYGCSANFVWEDTSTVVGEGDVDDRERHPLYIGAAGHCFLGEGPADSRAARQHEEGTDTNQRIDAVKVCADCTFGGATGLLVQGPVIELGDVVYARQTSPVEDDDGGVGHDFGLVEIKPDQEEAVDPSMPEFGGPTGVSDAAVPAGTPINQYGAGIGNGEVYPTQGSNGSSLGDGGTDNDAWFAALRATPGDSGSPIQSSAAGTGVEGDEAAGILTHITTLGTAGTTMGRCKEMVAEDIDKDIEAVLPGEL